MRKILVSPFIGIIYIYKYLISPMLPRGCRHFPSCSSYAIDALNLYGLIRGGMMAADRIARCRPWGTSGYDPVPRFLFKKIDLSKVDQGKQIHYPSCDRLKHH